MSNQQMPTDPPPAAPSQLAIDLAKIAWFDLDGIDADDQAVGGLARAFDARIAAEMAAPSPETVDDIARLMQIAGNFHVRQTCGGLLPATIWEMTANEFREAIGALARRAEAAEREREELRRACEGLLQACESHSIFPADCTLLRMALYSPVAAKEPVEPRALWRKCSCGGDMYEWRHPHDPTQSDHVMRCVKCGKTAPISAAAKGGT